MEVRLNVVHGKANVKEIVLGRDTLIGRGSECNLKIASSQVSRKHCRIQVTDSTVLVTDLGSANGTLLNGSAIPKDSPTAVDPGSELEIGPLRFAVRFDSPRTVQASSDDTAHAVPETVRSERQAAAAALATAEQPETVDFVPDEHRLRELRRAVAAARDESAEAFPGATLSPTDTVMDLNLTPPPRSEPATETFAPPTVSVGSVEETLLLFDSGSSNSGAGPMTVPAAQSGESAAPAKRRGIMDLFRRKKPEPAAPPASATPALDGSGNETLDLSPAENPLAPAKPQPGKATPPPDDDALQAFFKELQ